MVSEKEKTIIVITILLLIVIGISHFYQNKIKCGDKYYILINQYIDTTNSTHGGDCSNGCLFMDVLEVKSALYYGLDNYSRYSNEYKRLFFSEEKQLRNDLKINQEVKIKWCETPYGLRVRGVYK